MLLCCCYDVAMFFLSFCVVSTFCVFVTLLLFAMMMVGIRHMVVYY